MTFDDDFWKNLDRWASGGRIVGDSGLTSEDIGRARKLLMSRMTNQSRKIIRDSDGTEFDLDWREADSPKIRITRPYGKAGEIVFTRTLENFTTLVGPLPVLDLYIYPGYRNPQDITGALTNMNRLTRADGFYTRGNQPIRWQDIFDDFARREISEVRAPEPPTYIRGMKIEELDEWGVEHNETYHIITDYFGTPYESDIAAVQSTNWEGQTRDFDFRDPNPPLWVFVDLGINKTALWWRINITDDPNPISRTSGWDSTSSVTYKIYLKGVVVKQSTVDTATSLSRLSNYYTGSTATQTISYSENGSIYSDLYRLTPDSDPVQHYAYFWVSIDPTGPIITNGSFSELVTDNSEILKPVAVPQIPYVPHGGDVGVFSGHPTSINENPNPEMNWYVNCDGEDYKVWTGRQGINSLIPMDLEIYRFPKRAKNATPVFVFTYKIRDTDTNQNIEVWYGMIFKGNLYQVKTIVDSSIAYENYSFLDTVRIETENMRGHATIRAAQMRESHTSTYTEEG